MKPNFPIHSRVHEPLLLNERNIIETESSARVNPVIRSDDVTEITILDKYKLLVDPNDQSLAQDLMRDGYWEVWVAMFMARRIQKGWNIVDIGANFGYYTMIFADFVTRVGTVFAFEPNLLMCNLIKASLWLNELNNVVIYPCALSNFHGTAQFYLPDDNMGDASISYKIENSNILDVPVRVLDDFNYPEINLIKIDAEGSEEAILDGAQKFLDYHPETEICMEWWLPRMTNPELLIDNLQGRGYNFYTIGHDGNTAARVNKTYLLTQGAEIEMVYMMKE